MEQTKENIKIVERDLSKYKNLNLKASYKRVN